MNKGYASVSYLTNADRIEEALELILRYGSIPGDHHKTWVIDQVVRKLVGNEDTYLRFVKEACDGEDGPNTYEWDCGIAP